MTTVDEALRLANEAAAAQNAIVSASQPSVPTQSGGRAMQSWDDITNAPTPVDLFIKLTDAGPQVDGIIYEKITATVDLKDCLLIKQIAWSVNGVAQYASTVDGITCLRDGRPWAMVLAEASRHLNSKGKAPMPFDTAELRLVVAEGTKPLRSNEDPAKLLKPGTILGYTPAFTSTASWFKVAKAIVAAKPQGGEYPLGLVTVTSLPVVKAGQTWKQAVFTLEDILPR